MLHQGGGHMGMLYLEHQSVGPGSGVPFHTHGPTFAETVYGRKVGGRRIWCSHRLTPPSS